MGIQHVHRNAEIGHRTRHQLPDRFVDRRSVQMELTDMDEQPKETILSIRKRDSTRVFRPTVSTVFPVQ